MNINLPKGDVTKDKVKLSADNIMFLRISDKGNLYLSNGKADGTETTPASIKINELALRIENQYQQNENTVLLLKFDRKMKYSNMVDVFDEINRAKIKDRRYAIQSMDQKDIDIVTGAGG
jgi:biopolymer transport protein ExbD